MSAAAPGATGDAHSLSNDHVGHISPDMLPNSSDISIGPTARAQHGIIGETRHEDDFLTRGDFQKCEKSCNRRGILGHRHDQTRAACNAITVVRVVGGAARTRS